MSFVSEIGPMEFVIGEGNADAMARLNPFRSTWVARPEGEEGFGSAFSGDIIPRSEWDDRIALLEKNKMRLSDLVRAKGRVSRNQSRTNYCWVFGAVAAVEAKMLVQGHDYISFSPASVGAPLVNYQNRGFWSTPAIRYLAEHGMVPTSMWPDTAIDRRYDNAETREIRKFFKVTEWWELRKRDFDQLASCLLSLQPVAVGFNWWGHAVCALDLVKTGSNRYGIRIANSHNDRDFIILKDGKEIPDDAVCPRVIQTKA
jgi:hypothetical protein